MGPSQTTNFSDKINTARMRGRGEGGGRGEGVSCNWNIVYISRQYLQEGQTLTFCSIEYETV